MKQRPSGQPGSPAVSALCRRTGMETGFPSPPELQSERESERETDITSPSLSVIQANQNSSRGIDMASGSCYYREPKAGDLIEVFRQGYRHWALYVGNGYVIHLAPPSEVCDAGIGSIMSVLSEKACIRKDLLSVVVGCDRYRVNNIYDKQFSVRPVNEIIKEAESRVGEEVDYSITSANCEHFVTDLRYGVAKSGQVDSAIFATKAAVGVMAVGAVAGLCYQLLKRRDKHKE